MFYNRLPM